MNLFKYYSCYYPEETCPAAYKGTIKEKFWEGEKMFYQTQMDCLGKWIKGGKKVVESSDNPKLNSLAKAIGPERFGVVFYIFNFYTKGNPWDNLDWLFEY